MKDKLKLTPLTRENFEEYGTIVSREGFKPKADTEVMTFYGGLAKFEFEGIFSFGLLEVVDRERVLNELERHTNSEELLFAIDEDVIITVAKPDNTKDAPILESLKAFKIEKGKGVVMKEGCWHWAPYPLAKKANCLVGFRFDTPNDDFETKELRKEYLVEG